MNVSIAEPTLWWGTADTPAPPAEVPTNTPVSLVVGVRPAAFSNAINVLFSIDSQPERILRGYVIRQDHATCTEYFQIDFPFIPPGSCVNYTPQLMSIGRIFTADDKAELPASFCVQCPVEPGQFIHDSSPPSANGPRFHYQTEFLARAHIPIEIKPEVIGVTPDGLRVDFYVSGGTMIGPRINATFTHHGGDWMRIRPDGIGIADIHATLLTESGERILAEYSGVLDLGEDGYEKAIKGIYPPNPPACVTPRFLTSGHEYAWLNRLQCFGTGFFDTRGPVLNYDMYTIRPREPLR